MAAGILGGGVAVGRGMSAVSAWTGMQTNPVLNQARTDSNPLRIKKVTPYILQLQRDSLTEISQVHFVLARHVAEGAVAGKYDPFFDRQEPGMEVTQKALRELEAMVQGIREGGPDFDICIEGHGKFNVGSAVTIAKVLEPFRPLVFEEPIPGMNAQDMREVRLGTTAEV